MRVTCVIIIDVHLNSLRVSDVSMDAEQCVQM